MNQILYDYQMQGTTWVYLSSLLIIAIYFKFSRVFSVRNLDLLGLISLAPGLLLVAKGNELLETGFVESGNLVLRMGFVWLLVVGLGFLIRLLMDPMMVRRPLLEPNMNAGGLMFIGASLLVFLMVNVVTKVPNENDIEGARRLDQMFARAESQPDDNGLMRHGPGYPPLHFLAKVATTGLIQPDAQLPEAARKQMIYRATSQAMAIMSHLMVVVGMILIGAWHFDNVRTGVAAATLYLMLPYTAQMTGRVDHVLPAALLVWSFVLYRMPLASGMMLGLGTGAIYYPIFLLPLWVAFYWHRGLRRFLLGFSTTLVVLVASLAFTSSNLASFMQQAQDMLGWTSLSAEGVDGFWAIPQVIPVYRIPVFVAFMVMCAAFALWPAHKNLGTLLSCTAAVMLGTQFWHAQEGGTFVGWYLPIMLMTIFRPNLEDRIALSVLDESWFARRRVKGARLANLAA